MHSHPSSDSCDPKSSSTNPLASAWRSIQDDIRASLGETVSDLWFSQLGLIESCDGRVVLSAPGSIYPIWIEENFKDQLYSTLAKHLGDIETVDFQVTDSDREATGPIQTVQENGETTSAASGGDRDEPGEGKAKKGKKLKKKKKLVSEKLSEKELPERGREEGLVEIFRFENFVVGDNSELAHAAARAVSDQPGKTYQPLYFYSACGLGKTHLLHAIGWESLCQRPQSVVLYVSAEKFANEFIDALQNNALVAFRKKYREADMLLIDDVQFLERKDGLQREFFHTFNSLIDLRKQIVLASDCPASEINQLEDRLVSRFQWGLTVEIHRPGQATREAILRRKRDDWSLRIDDHTISRIVERVQGNVRLLEGALIRVAMTSTMSEKELTDELIDETLCDMCDTPMVQSVGMREIKEAVAEHYAMEVKVLNSKSRTARVAEARQVAMYLIRTLTDHSLVEIASDFGKDHGTVIYAVKKIKGRLETSSSLKNTIELIRRRLVRGGTGERSRGRSRDSRSEGFRGGLKPGEGVSDDGGEMPGPNFE